MRRISAIAFIGLFTACGFAQTSQKPRHAPPKAVRSAARRRPVMHRLPAHVLLTARIAQIDFDEAPLSDVVQFLGQLSGRNIFVNWNALAQSGVDRDKPINVRAKNIRFGQVLWMVLKEAAGPDVRLAYRIDNEILQISTAADLGQVMVTRVYPVKDLIQSRFAHPSISFGQERTVVTGLTPVLATGAVGFVPQIDVIRSGVIIRYTDVDGRLDEDDEGDDSAERERLLTELVDVITTAVEPDSWLVNGGLGSISPWNGMLVVRNTPLVHQQIGGYLSSKYVP